MTSITCCCRCCPPYTHTFPPYTLYRIQQEPLKGLTPERQAELIAKFGNIDNKYLETLFRLEGLPVELQTKILIPLLKEVVGPVLQRCQREPIHTFTVQEATSISFHPSGTMIAVGTRHGGIQLWDTIHGETEPLNTLLPDVGIFDVSFSPDGNRLVSNVNPEVASSRLIIWNNLSTTTTLLEEVANSPLEEISISSLSFSADGSKIASGSHGIRTSGVQLWDASSPEIKRIRHYPTPHNIDSVSFSPVNSLVASGSSDGRIQVWDTTSPSPNPIHNFLDSSGPVRSVSFNKDGTLIASTNNEGRLNIWDIHSSNLMPQLIRSFDTGYEFTNSYVAFSPVSSLVAAGGKDTVQIWDIALPYSLPLYTYKTNKTVESISFSGDGTKIVSMSEDVGTRNANINIWDLQPQSLKELYDSTLINLKQMFLLVVIGLLYKPEQPIKLNEMEQRLFDPLPESLKHDILRCFGVRENKTSDPS